MNDSVTGLLLIPTRLEREKLEPLLLPMARETNWRMELCGFGPIAAAARTMQLISAIRPRQVTLVGIAGSLRPELEVGTAHRFQRVRCDGIGVGSGTAFQSAGEIGWKQWEPAGAASDDATAEIGDTIVLTSRGTEATEPVNELLTVCAASTSEAEAARRRARYPAALAEDMEGFGVAMACSLCGISLRIIRGISNRAGDRDKRNWEIDAALHAAASLTHETLSA